jgi:hypothetical protein
VLATESSLTVPAAGLVALWAEAVNAKSRTQQPLNLNQRVLVIVPSALPTMPLLSLIMA